MPDIEKTRENRLRRMAERQGLYLQKSARRDSMAVDYGVYWIVESSNDMVVSGSQFGLDLDEVEEYLTSDRSAAGGTPLATVKLEWRNFPEFTASLEPISRQIAALGESISASMASALQKSVKGTLPSFEAISQAWTAQSREALAPILESVGQSFQVNESIRRLAQQAAAYNVATPSLSEVLRVEKSVHIGPYQELADDSTRGAYVLHEELLSYLKRNRTEAGVVTVLMVLVSYLGNKDEIFESAGEHAAGIQQALEALWNFAVDLLVWLGRTTS